MALPSAILAPFAIDVWFGMCETFLKLEVALDFHLACNGHLQEL